MHLTLVPYIRAAGEFKTKPTQHSVQKLREIGIQCDVLVVRCEQPLPEESIKKMAMFCTVAGDAVFQSIDVDTVYRLPLTLSEQGLDQKLAALLNIWSRASRLSAWEEVVKRITEPRRKVTVGFIGKYVQLVESYKSLNEALLHGGIANDCQVEIKHIDSEELEKQGTGVARRLRRHPRRARLRRARHRGQDRGGPLRAREQGPVLRHLLRHAAGVHRVRAPRRAASSAPTRPRSIRRRRTRSST